MQQLENNFEKIVSGAVTANFIVENSGEGDHDQNVAPSPFGRKGIIFWIGAALALLLVVGVILGVTIPLTTNNNNESPSIDSVVTPTQSPVPIKTPTATPTACTSRGCLLAEILLQNEVSGAEALQDDSSPQFQALRWLVNEDTVVLDMDGTPTVILVERYVLAMLYFATRAEDGLDVLNFLSASSVCEWNDGGRGILCNENDLVVGKSKHKEVIILISKCRIGSPVYFPFRVRFGGD
jgi:hypothetical protein